MIKPVIKEFDHVNSSLRVLFVYVFIKYLKKNLIFLFFYFKLIFLDYFDALISKIIFLKNKNIYYFNIFLSKKQF
jgi:hypothetical protein